MHFDRHARALRLGPLDLEEVARRLVGVAGLAGIARADDLVAAAERAEAAVARDEGAVGGAAGVDELGCEATAAGRAVGVAVGPERSGRSLERPTHTRFCL